MPESSFVHPAVAETSSGLFVASEPAATRRNAPSCVGVSESVIVVVVAVMDDLNAPVGAIVAALPTSTSHARYPNVPAAVTMVNTMSPSCEGAFG